MRELDVSVISDAVSRLCIESNKTLPADIEKKIRCSACREESTLARNVLEELGNNLDAAKKLDIPICQDTGMAVVFLEIGQDVHLVGGDVYEAINRGTADGYQKGLLRKSVVSDPLCRVNTGDNTPAVIHTSIIPGEKVIITVAPKGFGSENMSAVRMLTPSAGREGVVEAVLDIVKSASNKPCPPMVIGVGIGGDFEQCALLSKKALVRDTDTKNSDTFYAELEEELLEKINLLDIGPQGFGGKTTALSINIEKAPTHIAGLPVAVNIGCHVTRHKQTEI